MSSFEFAPELSDEKSYLLRYYLEFTNSYYRSAPAIKKKINLRSEVQSGIVREILNAFFADELPEVPVKVNENTSRVDPFAGDNLFAGDLGDTAENMVSTEEYAKHHGVSKETVLNWIAHKRLPSAKKMGKYKKWYVNKNEVPLPRNLRKDRVMKKPGQPYYKRKNEGSAADVEAHILKKELFTDAIASFIRTYPEMNYYVKNHYREVFWDGRTALIIDVNPDYISSKTGMRNRDLMLEGKAPVVPKREWEEYVFHIHHVGQLQVSPFAIIPEYDHNSKEMSVWFHQGPARSDLHGKAFEIQKLAFWRRYIEEYDKAGKFADIPHLNSLKKR